MEPEKPFACTLPDCGMTFTNEDHLHVHTKKHDMVLQLGMEQKGAFVADQTPTPTRFIRNCEEVGLFQDLQNVNPFDEGFKRAMETKHGILSLEGTSTEDLHTPHLVFPLEPGDCAQYTANNQRNITISRSSSDESGAVKEYETTTISKLTNEVTTISRVVKDFDKNDEKHDTISKEVNETVYTNNVIKIQSNVEIRNMDPKDKDDKNLPPIMSQKSLDYVVDSLADCGDKNKVSTQLNANKEESISIKKNDDKKLDDYEVIIKLPNGKHVRMKAIDEEVQNNAKEKLKKIIKNKVNVPKVVQNVPNVQNGIVQIPSGTLIPVTLLSPSLSATSVPKVPIVQLKNNYKSVKRKSDETLDDDKNDQKTSKQRLDSRSAASKRYRERLKQTMRRQSEENKLLREVNQKLAAERAVLKLIITQHLKKCPMGDDLRNIQEKLQNANQNLNF